MNAIAPPPMPPATFHVVGPYGRVLRDDFGTDLLAAMAYAKANGGPPGLRRVMRSDGAQIAACPRSKVTIPRAETLGIRLPEAGIDDDALALVEEVVG